MTSQEYWDEVESTARAIRERVRDDGAEDGDALFEAVDQHRWLIYTRYHYDILEHTRSDDYGFDQGVIDLSEAKDTASVIQQLAFWAFTGDVQEAYQGLGDDDEGQDDDVVVGAAS